MSTIGATMELEMREAELAVREAIVAKREQSLADELSAMSQINADQRAQLDIAREAGNKLAREVRRLSAALAESQRELAKAKAVSSAPKESTQHDGQTADRDWVGGFLTNPGAVVQAGPRRVVLRDVDLK